MKKFLGFLFLLLVLVFVTVVFTASTVYVCETGSKINLKSVGINYECSCSKINPKEMVCEQIRDE